jgi:DNA-binding MarR family transcriptional regulator
MSDPGSRTTLGAEELQTWAALATVLEWLPPVLDAQLQRDADLTHFEYGVLFALGGAADHALRMSVLAGYANSSLTRLSRAVTRLEKKDWVRRSVDPSDGRYTVATLTDLGAQKLDQATPGHEQTVRHILGALTRAQVRQLHEISQRVLQSLRDEKGWQPPGVVG